ncbi:gasdermin-B [Talpa occidentalis]|uniref:gasdermin-B n=1 Tax=Talpa occidentalis TaxID=50954 RepID=UPI0023F72CEC|nr:gasdermin-B [Talpa occidentalis]
MPSIFEKMTKTVVKELDSGGSMIAAKSIVSSDKFQYLSLVMGRRSFWGQCYYISTGLTLEDILESTESDVTDSSVQGPTVKLECQDDTKLSVKLPLKVRVGAGVQQSQVQEISVCQRFMSQKDLDSLDNRNLKEELPASFKSIRDMRGDLYLVSGILRNEKEETLKKNLRRTFFFQVLAPPVSSDGRGEATYKDHHERSVTIPADRVLAYQVEQLFFHNEGIMNIFVLDKKNSFPEKGGNAACTGWWVSGKKVLHVNRKMLEDRRIQRGRSGTLEDSENLEDFGNFEKLKEKVEDMEEILEDLTEKEKQALFDCLKKDVQQLRDLQQRVSVVLCSGELQLEEDTEDDTVDTLMMCLFNNTGALVEKRAEAVLNFLEALIELSEDLQLVDEIREAGTLPQLKDQVESTLKQNGDEQPPNVDDDLETPNLHALYVVVSILLLLSGKPSSESS